MSLLSSCVTNDEYQNTVQGNAEALWKILMNIIASLTRKVLIGRRCEISIYGSSITRWLERQQFEVMANMLSELKDGHVNLYTSF